MAGCILLVNLTDEESWFRGEAEAEGNDAKNSALRGQNQWAVEVSYGIGIGFFSLTLLTTETQCWLLSTM